MNSNWTEQNLQIIITMTHKWFNRIQKLRIRWQAVSGSGWDSFFLIGAGSIIQMATFPLEQKKKIDDLVEQYQSLQESMVIDELLAIINEIELLLSHMLLFNHSLSSFHSLISVEEDSAIKTAIDGTAE